VASRSAERATGLASGLSAAGRATGLASGLSSAERATGVASGLSSAERATKLSTPATKACPAANLVSGPSGCRHCCGVLLFRGHSDQATEYLPEPCLAQFLRENVFPRKPLHRTPPHVPLLFAIRYCIVQKTSQRGGCGGNCPHDESWTRLPQAEGRDATVDDSTRTSASREPAYNISDSLRHFIYSSLYLTSLIHRDSRIHCIYVAILQCQSNGRQIGIPFYRAQTSFGLLSRNLLQRSHFRKNTPVPIFPWQRDIFTGRVPLNEMAHAKPVLELNAVEDDLFIRDERSRSRYV
jgi:hypothetical protein